MNTDLPLKYTKGVGVIKSKTREEMKEYRKEVIDFTRSLIEKGVTNYGAKKEALMKKFNVTDRMAKKYIKYAKEDMLKRKDAENQESLATMIIQLEYLYRMAVEANNFKEAREVSSEIIKLKGLAAPKQVSIKTQVKHQPDLSHLSTEQLLLMQNIYNNPQGTIDISHDAVE